MSGQSIIIRMFGSSTRPTQSGLNANCPIVAQSMICKHIIKMFEILHLEIEDKVIMQHASTFHDIERTFSSSICFINYRRLKQVHVVSQLKAELFQTSSTLVMMLIKLPK